MFFNRFCLDVCPFANEELHPGIEFCKILDCINENESCPAMIFSEYLSKKLRIEEI